MASQVSHWDPPAKDDKSKSAHQTGPCWWGQFGQMSTFWLIWLFRQSCLCWEFGLGALKFSIGQTKGRKAWYMCDLQKPLSQGEENESGWRRSWETLTSPSRFSIQELNPIQSCMSSLPSWLLALGDKSFLLPIPSWENCDQRTPIKTCVKWLLFLTSSVCVCVHARADGAY